VDTLAQKAIKDLGVQVSALAQPYKLMLYETGAFSKAHLDTKKVLGNFGTLVICLPSEHTGGEVAHVHGKEKRVLETASNSAFGLSALAWYSDISHATLPVKSGYQLVLAYNIVQDSDILMQSASALNANCARLEKLLHVENTVRK
jgi:hypothetical protein